MLSDVTEEVDITLGSLQTEVALGLATRAILITGFWSKVILNRLSGDLLVKKILETVDSVQVFVLIFLLNGWSEFFAIFSVTFLST